MDKDRHKPMTPFDELISSTTLQMLKLLIPYIPKAQRPALALFIKLSEFQKMMNLFHSDNKELQSVCQDGSSGTLFDFLNIIRPYLNSEDLETLDTMLSLKEMMSMMDFMQETDFESSETTPTGKDSDYENQ